jgi:hypothetical protein|tara:strand:- start:1444 stop:2649 length:1206 start_codon:yes stop_codon:yes gene_type:complete
VSKISNVVGITAIFFILLCAVSIIFPALFSSIFGKFSENLNPFELGIFGIPLIISNITFLSFGILYYKKKLPRNIFDLINKIRIFEIPKKPTLIILLIIFSVYIGFSIPELSLDESEQWDDYEILEDALEIWPYGESENIFIEEQNDRYVRMFLLDFSLNTLQNIKILPFIASIFTIFFTYLLTVQISQKRFAGIISMLVLIQSHTFLRFDTVAVYENFWILFYLLSIYIIRKKWFLASPVFYILAFFSKAFVGPYFIMTLFFAFRTKITLTKKLSLLLVYTAIILTSIVIIFAGDTIYPEIISLDSSKFFIGLATFGTLLRYDFLLLLTILPVVVGLVLLAKNHLKEADSILLLILGTLIAGPILIMFTNFYEILPYRYIPLIVFFAIGIGMFFSKKSIS